MKIRVLSEADCRAVLDMSAAIDIQAEAFSLLAAGKSVEGLRSFATSKNPPGVAIFNPCFLIGGAGYGIKVVSDFYGNDKKRVPRMSALVALFDGNTGFPTTVMEAGYLTDLRTGAGTGLAARHLARKDSRTVAIIGAGRVARNQLEALATLFDLKTVLVATRTEARGLDFIRRMSSRDRIPSDMRLLASREEAIRQSDIVVAATTSTTPVIEGKWLRPGTFVASAGAYEPTSREVDTDTVKMAARRVIDSRKDCLDHAGDFMIPEKEGAIARDSIAEIAEVVSGKRPGRQSGDELTYYKSIGVPIQDLVTARHIERLAIAAGRGTEIEIGGDEG
ncbi:MAG: ornithine cyclodeaminase family protein [Betaproteobacteria bacterium]|nr:ornithine cyclodeaminase family protein [Betaproteobacteria bacterium]